MDYKLIEKNVKAGVSKKTLIIYYSNNCILKKDTCNNLRNKCIYLCDNKCSKTLELEITKIEDYYKNTKDNTSAADQLEILKDIRQLKALFVHICFTTNNTRLLEGKVFKF